MWLRTGSTSEPDPAEDIASSKGFITANRWLYSVGGITGPPDDGCMSGHPAGNSAGFTAGIHDIDFFKRSKAGARGVLSAVWIEKRRAFGFSKRKAPSKTKRK
jgi:hypothetical protein